MLTLDDWLRNYIGDDQASNGSVTIIDLSLVPAEVVHIITAVIARMTLEALQRYRKLHHGKTLPTVLVMEGAHLHQALPRRRRKSELGCYLLSGIREDRPRRAQVWTRPGAVIPASSELSPTVLSQCNSYLLHRISNDQDKELVHKLVPDNLRGLLRDLPSLPSRHAILLGWASRAARTGAMIALPEQHRPKSDDPDFWAVWSGKNRDGEAIKRCVNWKAIADDWQQMSATQPEAATPNSEEQLK